MVVHRRRGHVVAEELIGILREESNALWLSSWTLHPSPSPVEPRQFVVEGDHAGLSFLQPHQLTVDGKRASLSFLHQQVNLHGIEAFVLH